jgi:predicted extracellular nuclease
VDPTALGGAAQQIAGGASIALAEGPLAFSFGDYVIWTTTLQYTNPPFPRPVRARNAGELTVAAQNLFRLFDDRDDPSLGEPVTPTATYQARLAAFSNHVRNVLGAPDVLAVSEVEDLTTLEDLAARLNADGGDYTAYLIEGNDIGGIDVGFLVRDAVSVDSVTQIGANDTWTAPGETSPELLNDRPPLLLTGSYTGNGEPFPIAVIAVHQRSLIDVETSQRVRAKREEQATRLASAIASMQDAQAGLRIAVTGDFNAFEFDDGYVDVMGILTSDADLTNQVLSVASNDRYSYIEDAVAQVLDHTLTSQPLNPFVRGFQFARANADAPAAANAPSDHDGLVLFVMSDHDADGLADDNDGCPTGGARATVIIGDCDSGAPNLSMGGGCTLADKLKEACEGAKNHGQCVSAAGKLLSGLMKDGLLTGAQKGAIESCVARGAN